MAYQIHMNNPAPMLRKLGCMTLATKKCRLCKIRPLFKSDGCELD